MTDDEMAKKGIEPDSVYETRRKGESLKGFMSRLDRMAIVHATVGFHLDRPLERADPIAKDLLEAIWDKTYGPDLIKEVEDSTT